MKLFSTVLLSIMGSVLFAGDVLFDQLFIHDQQQAHLAQVNLYLANPYVALPPKANSTSSLFFAEGIQMQDLRGNECFGQPDATNEFCKQIDLQQTTPGATAFGAILTITTDYVDEDITLSDIRVAGTSVPASDITDNGDGPFIVDGSSGQSCASVSIDGTPQNINFGWSDDSDIVCNADDTWCDQPASIYQTFFGNYDVSQSGASYYRHITTNSWNFEIPSCGTGTPIVVGAYLNWMGRALRQAPGSTFDTNLDVTINGGTVNPVTEDDDFVAIGDFINATGFTIYGEFHSSVADITALVAAELAGGTAGTHTIEVSGFTPPDGGTDNRQQNFGVGLTVIYECSDYERTQIAYYAGNDFIEASPTLEDATDPSSFVSPGPFSTEICIEFPAGTEDKSIDMLGIFGGQGNDVAPFRGHRFLWLSGTGTPPSSSGQFPEGVIALDPAAQDIAPPNTIFQSNLGLEWDTMRAEIVVPASDEWMCAQIWSVQDDDSDFPISVNLLAPIFKMNNPCPSSDMYTLCDDGSESLTLETDPNLTDINWLNESGVSVGNMQTLVVTSATDGMSDGSETFYYTATDAAGCAAELCCPVMVVTEPCIECINPIAEAGNDEAICRTTTFDLSGATITPTDLVAMDATEFGATWTRSGTGDFLDAMGNILPDPVRFGEAVSYRPSPADVILGNVALTLTTDDPSMAPFDLADCEPAVDELLLTILDVDCGTFPWGGE